jgi:uncharacterized protein (TIGR01244 family)
MDLDAFAKVIPYGACPRDEIVTAGQPTAAQFADAAREGIKTVIDLRAPNEPRGFDEAAAIEAAGMEYVVIPVTPVSLNDAVFDKFLAVMRDVTRRPVMVHCQSANRVGGLLLPYFVLDEKMSEPAALKLAQQVGLRSSEYASMAIDYARRHAVPK